MLHSDLPAALTFNMKQNSTPSMALALAGLPAPIAGAAIIALP